ncbi:hypothetical protein D7Y41_14880 [Anaerotruncus sp. 1XD22-93]|nr:hypothetical protein [Lachnospiraceae bacterium]NBI75319.1 hypothetical protein [Lachnospiraceae bacterium]RKJ93654.1 hypothetical protein D7Y41_14880 [Anaerotruncus sp. 1XD22-93]
MHEYRECNPPVQVKGSRLAQFSGASPLSTGYYLTLKAARNQLRCRNPFQGNFQRMEDYHNEINKTQWSCREKWCLQS